MSALRRERVGSFLDWGRGDEGMLGIDEGETDEGEGESGGKRFSWERRGKEDAAALRGVSGGSTAIELPPLGEAGNGGREEGDRGKDVAAALRGVRGGSEDPAREGVSGGREDAALAAGEGVRGGREVAITLDAA